MADRGRHKGREGADPALVAALAAGRTAQDAAREAGVSERTVYRRLDDPAFKRRVEEAKAEMLGRAVAMLTSASVEAVETLRGLLDSELDFARLAAARAILDVGHRYREQLDLAARVAALEERLGEPQEGKQPWKPRMA